MSTRFVIAYTYCRFSNINYISCRHRYLLLRCSHRSHDQVRDVDDFLLIYPIQIVNIANNILLIVNVIMLTLVF